MKNRIERAHLVSEGVVDIVTYENGKADVVKRYNINEFLISEIPYKDGKMDGLAKYYHINGALMSETPYKDGCLVNK
ncbi:hypothetical protein CCY99_01900 [Helicobacter sp. 16-1353]|uniref:toxin-antitoxin system YwqK family antitoxin n=1 Tax=Helicobacter sp. 16-1353 TaxID=2004996 RepID=UPI000DCF0FD1|nr:hypothetical protein [Helicobacter sp. 16-1353]RAX54920.1 hypothetical protein CCY99_01900 [Helicobacter sp. 16-1353]